MNTPHRNGARVKGAGVDCGQYPIMVYSSLGLMEDPKPATYPRDFHLHRGEEFYLEYARAAAHELPEGSIPQKGDFALFKIGRVFSHGAIVIAWPKIIHAYVKAGVIYADADQGELAGKPVKFFSFWGAHGPADRIV